MLAGPMTVIVVLAVLIGAIVGAVFILRSMRHSELGDETAVCPQCRSPNMARAKFCSQCGVSLEKAS